jgi:hypothetical protein
VVVLGAFVRPGWRHAVAVRTELTPLVVVAATGRPLVGSALVGAGGALRAVLTRTTTIPGTVFPGRPAGTAVTCTPVLGAVVVPAARRPVVGSALVAAAGTLRAVLTRTTTIPGTEPAPGAAGLTVRTVIGPAIGAVVAEATTAVVPARTGTGRPVIPACSLAVRGEAAGAVATTVTLRPIITRTPATIIGTEPTTVVGPILAEAALRASRPTVVAPSTGRTTVGPGTPAGASGTRSRVVAKAGTLRRLTTGVAFEATAAAAGALAPITGATCSTAAAARVAATGSTVAAVVTSWAALIATISATTVLPPTGRAARATLVTTWSVGTTSTGT